VPLSDVHDGQVGTAAALPRGIALGSDRNPIPTRFPRRCRPNVPWFPVGVPPMDGSGPRPDDKGDADGPQLVKTRFLRWHLEDLQDGLVGDQCLLVDGSPWSVRFWQDIRNLLEPLRVGTEDKLAWFRYISKKQAHMSQLDMEIEGATYYLSRSAAHTCFATFLKPFYTELNKCVL
jgi:hypothetical protein